MTGREPASSSRPSAAERNNTSTLGRDAGDRLPRTAFDLEAGSSRAALLLLGPAASARAGDVILVQKDKTFARPEITVRAGDRVEFRNEDPVVHNIDSVSPGFKFEIKTQLPGQTAEERFVGEGAAEVRCAIHPQMKLEVKVEKWVPAPGGRYPAAQGEPCARAPDDGWPSLQPRSSR